VSAVLCFKFPEVAVIVAVYVPTGVPGVPCEDEPPPPPPPHPRNEPNVNTIIDAASVGSLCRLRRKRNP
jgi:hypothetical protein